MGSLCSSTGVTSSITTSPPPPLPPLLLLLLLPAAPSPAPAPTGRKRRLHTHTVPSLPPATISSPLQATQATPSTVRGLEEAPAEAAAKAEAECVAAAAAAEACWEEPPPPLRAAAAEEKEDREVGAAPAPPREEKAPRLEEIMTPPPPPPLAAAPRDRENRRVPTSCAAPLPRHTITSPATSPDTTVTALCAARGRSLLKLTGQPGVMGGRASAPPAAGRGCARWQATAVMAWECSRETARGGREVSWGWCCCCCAAAAAAATGAEEEEKEVAVSWRAGTLLVLRSRIGFCLCGAAAADRVAAAAAEEEEEEEALAGAVTAGTLAASPRLWLFLLALLPTMLTLSPPSPLTPPPLLLLPG